MLALKIICFIVGLALVYSFGLKTHDAAIAEDSDRFLGYFLFTIAGFLLASIIFM